MPPRLYTPEVRQSHIKENKQKHLWALRVNQKWTFSTFLSRCIVQFNPILRENRLHKVKTLGNTNGVTLKGKNPHFQLMCVAEKRLCFSSLLTHYLPLYNCTPCADLDVSTKHLLCFFLHCRRKFHLLWLAAARKLWSIKWRQGPDSTPGELLKVRHLIPWGAESLSACTFLYEKKVGPLPKPRSDSKGKPKRFYGETSAQLGVWP